MRTPSTVPHLGALLHDTIERTKPGVQRLTLACTQRGRVKVKSIVSPGALLRPDDFTRLSAACTPTAVAWFDAAKAALGCNIREFTTQGVEVTPEAPALPLPSLHDEIAACVYAAVPDTNWQRTVGLHISARFPEHGATVRVQDMSGARRQLPDADAWFDLRATLLTCVARQRQLAALIQDIELDVYIDPPSAHDRARILARQAARPHESMPAGSPA